MSRPESFHNWILGMANGVMKYSGFADETGFENIFPSLLVQL